MSVPSCPVHRSPMKLGRDNKTFFCPRKDSQTGEWCKEKASTEPPATAQAPATTHHATPASASPKLLLLLGSLEFSARVYQGTGQSEDAIALANEVFRLNSMESGI